MERNNPTRDENEYNVVKHSTIVQEANTGRKPQTSGKSQNDDSVEIPISLNNDPHNAGR